MKNKTIFLVKKYKANFKKLINHQNHIPRYLLDIEKHQPEPLIETKYKILFLSIIALFCLSIINKASFIDQTTVTSFAKGNACTAVIGSLESTYKNPAGIAYISQKKISSMMGSYFNNRYTLNEFSFAIPINHLATVAIHLPSRKIKNIPYQETQLQTTEYFEDKKSMYQISIAKKFQQELISIGLSIGQIQKNIHTLKASGNFIHLGTMIHLENLTIGAAVQNIGNLTLDWSHGNKEKISQQYFLGTCFKFNNKTQILLDLESNTNNLSFNTGISYQFSPSIAIMGGINDFSSSNASSRVGIQLFITSLETSYAYTYHPHLGVIHKIKFSYDLV